MGITSEEEFQIFREAKENLVQSVYGWRGSGKKMSPEQVHLEPRKVLTPSEYVSRQEICSLFSR